LALCADPSSQATAALLGCLTTHHAPVTSCCVYLQSLFDRYIDANSLVTGMEKEEASVLKSKRVTPKMFAHSIKQKCIANPQRIVLPEVCGSM
jgi:hypothetical protein